MSEPAQQSQRLIDLAGKGDALARRELLERHRDDLRRMVAARLDRRVAARIDPSDVVQETLTDAAQRLDEYGAEGKPLDTLSIQHFPTIFVLDVNGVIRYKEIRGEELEKAVNKLLDEAPARPKKAA